MNAGTMGARFAAFATLFVVAALARAWPVPRAESASASILTSASLAQLREHPHVPVRLSLESRVSGHSLTLTVRLERSDLYATLPALLDLRLPQGVTLPRGETTVSLATGKAVTHVVELWVDGAPVDDLVAEVDIRGEGRTARGEARHRFGRPEPRLPDMPRLPDTRPRGGGSLGTRIRVAPIPR